MSNNPSPYDTPWWERIPRRVWLLAFCVLGVLMFAWAGPTDKKDQPISTVIEPCALVLTQSGHYCR